MDLANLPVGLGYNIIIHMMCHAMSLERIRHKEYDNLNEFFQPR